jgi:predicted transcriptional regulator
MHSFRVDDQLWQAAQAAAEGNGETVTDVLRRALTNYVRRTARTTDAVQDRMES